LCGLVKMGASGVQWGALLSCVGLPGAGDQKEYACQPIEGFLEFGKSRNPVVATSCPRAVSNTKKLFQKEKREKG